MQPVESLEQRWRQRSVRKVQSTVCIDDVGISLGAGTLLAGMRENADGAQSPDIAADAERTLALLAAAQGRGVSPKYLTPITAAAEHWRRGDKALANLRLIFSDLPQVDHEAAYRLFLAETLLAAGFSPRALLQEIGVDTAPLDLFKYDPDQPRVPAGSGEESGRWTSGGRGTDVSGKSPIPAAAGVAAGTFAENLFAAEVGSAFLTGLATFGGVVGAFAGLGVLLFPSGIGGKSEGDVPGDSGLRYSFDRDEGVLRLTRNGDTGTKLIAAARLGRDGTLYENETGEPVARLVGGSVVFGDDTFASVTAHVGDIPAVGSKAEAVHEDNNPKLCPDPGPDIPHGASDRAVLYQAQISALNNPQRPLPPGLAVRLPLASAYYGFVYFDDCRERDGAMIEAKGPGLAKLLRDEYLNDVVLPSDWKKQAWTQVQAAGNRAIEWYFAEPEAAARAQEVFNSVKGLKGRIHIYVEPARVW